jgi:hypothetical protein
LSILGLHEFVGTKISEFSRNSVITATPYAYPNFLNKGNNPLRMQMPNYFNYLSIFVDASENLVMANDVATFSNPQVTLVEKKNLKKHHLT